MTRRDIEKAVRRAADESMQQSRVAGATKGCNGGALVELDLPFAQGWKLEGYMLQHRHCNPTRACSLVSPEGVLHQTGALSYAVSFFYQIMKGWR